MADDYGPSVPIEISQSEEYRALKDAVQQYMDAEPEDGYDVWRALASLLGSAARDRFKKTLGCRRASRDNLYSPTDHRRRGMHLLVDEVLDRPRAREHRDRDEPLHAPPHHDHPSLWLDDGEPVLCSMHVYNPELQVVSKTASEQQQQNGWFDIVAFAREWGPEIGVTPYSWYNLFSTVNVVFYAPEWLRERS